MSKKGVIRQRTKDGKPNPKYVDLLKVDPPIAGQQYGCFSFVTPDKILKKKELFYFEKFVKQWEMNKTMEKFHQFLNFLSFKYKCKVEDVLHDLEDFVKEEKQDLMQEISLENDYKNFLDKEQDALDKEFDRAHQFQTSVTGLKVRGHFATQEEAELRAKLLRESDPDFDVFVGPVGVWMPWEPDAYKTGRVEYLEEELNQLVKEKQKNQSNAKQAFEQRIQDAKENASKENASKEKEKEKEKEVAEPKEVMNVLFDHDNISTKKD